MDPQVPKLTRYLYLKDEVILSLLNSLLQKKDLNECLFWVSELYYTGYHAEIWTIIWTIYYDFYAIKNIKLENHFINNYKKWVKNPDIVPVLSVIKNLHNSVSTPDVFCMRLLMKTQNNKEHSTKRTHLPKEFKLSLKFKKLFLAIYRKDYKNIAFYIKKFKNMEEEIVNIIFLYASQGLFKEIPKMPLNTENKNVSKIKLKFKTHPYKNKLHILLAILCSCYHKNSDIITNQMFRRASANDITFVKDIDQIPCSPIYKTLACKRIYAISPNIGCFQLMRHKKEFPPHNKILWYHWEYFAFLTPLWHKRFEPHKIKKDDTKYEINFENDDELEEFHEKYGFEPDEQSKEIQEKSILEIPDISMHEWLIDTFSNHPLIELIQDIKYIY